MNQLSVDQMACAITEFIRTEANFPDPLLISEHSRLFDLGVVDSLMIVSLMGFCEEMSGCQISPDDLTEENLSTPYTLAELVRRSALSIPA